MVENAKASADCLNYSVILNATPAWSEDLKNAVEKGQKPEYLMLCRSVGPSVFNVGPAKIFPVTFDDTEASIASAAYSGHHLGTEKAIVVVTDKDLNPAAKDKRAAAMALLAEKAKILAENFHGPVAGCYLDSEGMEIIPASALSDAHAKNVKVKGNFGLFTNFFDGVSGSCCDSRAGHSHIYSEQPGETYNVSTIAGVLSPTLLQKIKESGAPKASVTGHSSCGGINAMVTWAVNGEKAYPGKALEEWLKYFQKEVSEVVAFAKTKGFLMNGEGQINKDVFALAEMWVTQKNGRELVKILGKENVNTNYFNITSRKLYALNPDASLEDTYKNVKDMSRLKVLCAPEMVQVGQKPKLPPKDVAKTRSDAYNALGEVFKKIAPAPSEHQKAGHAVHGNHNGAH